MPLLGNRAFYCQKRISFAASGAAFQYTLSHLRHGSYRKQNALFCILLFQIFAANQTASVEHLLKIEIKKVKPHSLNL
jgi:hypothetical protein